MEPAPAYRAQLDGVRAFAATAVVLAHVGWDGPYGHQAVRLFFLLSGFLISGILLDARPGAAGGPWPVMRSFYARRALRIFPAYFLLLGLTALAVWPDPPAGLPWFAAYLGNFYIAQIGRWPDLVSHLWTLAVEEQFYLVWPLFILLVPRRWMFPALVCVIAGSILSRVVTFPLAGEIGSYVLPWASFDALGLGALIAWFVRLPGMAPPRPRALAVVFVVSAAALSWLGTAVSGRTYYIALEALWLIPHACAVLGAYIGFGGVPGRLLDNRISLFLGRISYGIYLYHILVASVLRYALEHVGLDGLFDNPFVAFPLTMLMTVAVAGSSWFVVERPILRLKARFAVPARTALSQ